MPADPIDDYRRTLAAQTPQFLLERRFVAEERWTKATTQTGLRYLGVFREHEPALPAILTHQYLLLLGEPGAGKSTTGRAIVQYLLSNGPVIPVIASLKSYAGDLRALLGKGTPAIVLNAPGRAYILDGIDEVPSNYRQAFVKDIKALRANDTAARIIITSRQAFAAQHPDDIPAAFTIYHLLDFDDKDVAAYAKHENIDPENFRLAIRDVSCEEEIQNPFVLTVMLERYKAQGSLSPLRSNNVDYVVTRLIQSRPLINTVRQRRALRMLGITCETAARNELTDDEAQRVLREAIDFTPAAAQELLDELSHSILIRSSTGISFQMRSYGEYLAAEELHDQPIDRLKELAFVGDTPIETWRNTITYLAEINDKVRAYFTQNYPEWLLNVSPNAFTEDERTTLAQRILRAQNNAHHYLVDQENIPTRRFARLLTPTVINDLQQQRLSAQPHEVANAIILLAGLRQPDIAQQALTIVTAHRNESSLRYTAILALIYAGERSVINDLIAFAKPSDTYHIHLIDAIGSLCTPTDFPVVLPILERTNAGLSAAYYHFRELTTKDALTAALSYISSNPASVDGYRLDGYLEPLIDLIPTHWDAATGARIGSFLAAAERAHHFLHQQKIADEIITHVMNTDQDRIVVRTLLTSLAADNTRLFYTRSLVAPLITPELARWVNQHTPQYAADFFRALPPGPARDLLDHRTTAERQYDDQNFAQHEAAEAQRQHRITSTREQHQDTISTSRDITAIIISAEGLQKEHWPALSVTQREWLAQTVNDTLVSYDLRQSIIWKDDRTWTHPRGLNPLLALIDHYNLHLSDDVPIVLALLSWHDEAISKYYRREGFTPAAHQELTTLLGTATNESIARNVLTFLRQAGYNAPAIKTVLVSLVLDSMTSASLRIEATERLATLDPNAPTFLTLAADQDAALRDYAFRHLLKQQHQPTIQRALATITDKDLFNGETPAPNQTTLDWIGSISVTFAIPPLKKLRGRTLSFSLWRVTTLITNTIASIDKTSAAGIITQQLPQTPPRWQQHFQQEAEHLKRSARIDDAQHTPFDTVIRKLKGVTSMIQVKVWCEGKTDRPIIKKLLKELGEQEIADTLDFVGGWPNLLAEDQPERWLDGCRKAVMIMDGDIGRKLTKKNQPYTDQADDVNRRFANYPLTLHVLRRYGIENYFPRQACEAVLQRNLAAYFPIPVHRPIEKHFREPIPFLQRLWNRLRRRPQPSFYQKRRNEEIAEHLTMADIQGTDVATILTDVKKRAEEAREF